MKKFIFVVILFLALPLSSMANEKTAIFGMDACTLFDILKTEIIDLSQDLHEITILQRTVPGLSCITTFKFSIPTKAVCSCLFSEDLSTEQMKDIYNRIDILEEESPSDYPKIYTKSVGELSFIRKMYNPDHYTFINEYEFPFLKE